MKLIIFLFLLAVANAINIHKDNNEITNKNDVHKDPLPTPTSQEPTKIKQKRSKITEYIQFQNITIFEEGWEEWDPEWVESSWEVQEGDRVFDGIIIIDLPDNAGFSLQCKTLESQYGFISFDYKLSATDDNTRLNFISFDDGDYVNQGNYLYTGNDYVHITQEIKDHEKDTYLPSIQRFAWQNYGNDKNFTLYLKNISYRNIKVEEKSYESAVPVIDSENCSFSPEWKDISKSNDRISFKMINGQCVMTMTTSQENPAIFQFNKYFYGGKLEIVIKSEEKDSTFTWYGNNSEPNSDVKELENTTFAVTNEYKTYEDDDFETQDDYNSLKITSVGGETTFQIIKFSFYPIVAEDKSLQYEITRIEEPDVIIDTNGIYWREKSWGSTKCEFDLVNSAMKCTFVGKPGSYPAFSVITDNDYNAGHLHIIMKVQYPEQVMNILAYNSDGTYNNVYTLYATDEYADYLVPIPSFTRVSTNRYCIQEASQKDNTFYIKRIAYYPPYLPLPDISKSNTTTKKKKTTTTRTATSSIKPTEPPREKTIEEKFEDIGYKSCTQSTKVVYADNTGVFGIENGGWCAIIVEKIDCWSILYGVQCCSEKATINGAWGKEENGTECGNPSPDACWAKEINNEYECCTITESEKGIVFVDESGAWGIKNNKWCGIK